MTTQKGERKDVWIGVHPDGYLIYDVTERSEQACRELISFLKRDADGVKPVKATLFISKKSLREIGR